MLNILPVEILLAVADLVYPQALRSMSQVSRRLRSIYIPLLYEAIEFRAPSEWALNIMDIDTFCQSHPTSRDRCYLQHTRHLCISAPIVFARFNRCAYFNIFRLSTNGPISSSLGTSNEAKAHAQFLDDLSRQLRMVQLQLKQYRLHSLQWHLGTCIPPGFLDSGGYIRRYQSSLKRLSLITDGSCPHAGQCLGGLCGLLSLQSLEWDGIRQGAELEILRACISRNRSHLSTLSIGLITPIEAMDFYTDVLGVPLNKTEARGSIGSTAIQYPSLLKLALSKILLPQTALPSPMPGFTSLKSLTLRYCPNSLEFLDSFTSTQAPPHLLHFEFSYESFTTNEIDRDVRPLVTFLLLINGLRHLYLKLSNFSNSFHVSRAISKHRPTLESFAYHERNLSAIDNEGLFEEVRDQTPAWLCCDSEVDLELLWNESDYIPTPPPCLASRHDLPATSVYDNLPFINEQLPFVEAIFCPRYDSNFGFSWPGPDPFSFSTSAEDMLLYASTFLVVEKIQYLEIRLLKLNVAGWIMEQFVYSISQAETGQQNFGFVRAQLFEVISRQGISPDPTGACRFQLVIYPQPKPPSPSITKEPALSCPSNPAPGTYALDPAFFVQNIVLGLRK
ncbi:uncharacterized protein N7469_001923 [Penicillium citrinum]|uniref:F-box domain-containing protein n=1 Tax=Penicillium citrinum TaxID=5077 RepID=A0A9W9P9J8_PENCI|nr:uncharacterized protein N7469_001923 [Penicillium citrinum]KAJ5240332.1 hypothetical protein N7469_001923 [Penicillium citrinum]